MSEIEINDYAEQAMLKEAEEGIQKQRQDAFCFGFLKAAYDLGYFEKDAAVVAVPAFNLSPASVLSIPRGVARTLTSGGGMLGTAAGIADAPDETEEELTRLQIRDALLKEQLEKLEADKTNQELRRVLAKRRQ